MARTLKIKVDASGIHKAAGAAGKLGARFAGVATKVKSLTAGLFSMKTAIIGFLGTRVVSFLKGMFVELGNAQIAARGLATAMKAGGNYTKQAYDNMLEYAQALTKVTAYDDDVIVGAMRMLATFKLNEETMKKATIATLDLAAATGQNLQSAAILMGKAAVGVTGQLKRYGIVVDEADLKARGFQAVMDEITKEFGGQAKMIRGTVTGQMMLLSNMWGDMKEDIAAAIVESGAFENIMQTMRSTIQDVVGYVKANPTAIADVFNAGIETGKTLLTITKSILPFFEYIVTHKEVLMGVLGAYMGAKAGAPFGPWGSLIGGIGGGVGGVAWAASLPTAAETKAEMAAAASPAQATAQMNIQVDTLTMMEMNAERAPTNFPEGY